MRKEAAAKGRKKDIPDPNSQLHSFGDDSLAQMSSRNARAMDAFNIILISFSLSTLALAQDLYFAEGGSGGSSPCTSSSNPCSTFNPFLLPTSGSATAHFEGTVSMTSNGPSSSLTSDLVLVGDSSDATLDLDGWHLFFDYATGNSASLTVQGLRIINGQSASLGGCVLVQRPGSGTFSFLGVTFENCEIPSGTGSAVDIRLPEAGGNVLFDECTFENNNTPSILSANTNVNFDVVLKNSIFKGNQGSSGAVLGSDATVTVEEVVFEDNDVDGGSLLSILCDDADVSDVTMNNNRQVAASGPDFTLSAILVFRPGVRVSKVSAFDNVVSRKVIELTSNDAVYELGECVHVYGNNATFDDGEKKVFALEEGTGVSGASVSAPDGTYIQTLHHPTNPALSTVIHDITTGGFSCGRDGFYVGEDSDGNALCDCPANNNGPVAVDRTMEETLVCECPPDEPVFFTPGCPTPKITCGRPSILPFNGGPVFWFLVGGALLAVGVFGFFVYKRESGSGEGGSDGKSDGTTSTVGAAIERLMKAFSIPELNLHVSMMIKNGNADSALALALKVEEAAVGGPVQDYVKAVDNVEAALEAAGYKDAVAAAKKARRATKDMKGKVQASLLKDDASVKAVKSKVAKKYRESVSTQRLTSDEWDVESVRASVRMR